MSGDVVLSKDSWARYAQQARKLDELRTAEAARTAAVRAAAAEMTTQADALEARLRGQGGMLLNLSGILRLRRPKLTPIAPEGFIEAPIALSDLAAAIDRGDGEARIAAERGEYPALLPGWSSTTRSLLVYGVAALIVLAFQGLAFNRTGTDTNPFLVLFIIPLIGFAVAFLVLSLGGRARVAQSSASQSTRMGFLICFLIGPVAAAVVLILSLQDSGSTG